MMQRDEAYAWLIDVSEALRRARRVKVVDKYKREVECVQIPAGMVEAFSKVLCKIAEGHFKGD